MNMPDKIWVQRSLSATVEKLPEKYFPDPQIPYVKADLAQSLADALELFLSDHENNQKNGSSIIVQTRGRVDHAKAALANYRKGE